MSFLFPTFYTREHNRIQLTEMRSRMFDLLQRRERSIQREKILQCLGIDKTFARGGMSFQALSRFMEHFIDNAVYCSYNSHLALLIQPLHPLQCELDLRVSQSRDLVAKTGQDRYYLATI